MAKKKDYAKLLRKSVKTKLPNLLLGITALVILILLAALLYPKNDSISFDAKKLTNLFQQEEQLEQKQTSTEKVYKVQEGDTLWKIAENAYGSGYNAYDIAEANKLVDSNMITPSQQLVLPSVEPKRPTKGETVMQGQTMTPKTSSYVVKQGDYLWKIAEKHYGDGHMWTKIAGANNILNPDLIYPGTTLTLP